MTRVFGTPTCAYCPLAKKYLSKKGVEFIYIDVAVDPPQEYKDLAHTYGTTVPMVVTDKGVMVGWNLSRLVELL